MKKIITLLLLLVVGLSVNIYAQKGNSTVKEMTKTVGEVWDSTKSMTNKAVTAVGDGLNTVDTSRVTKELYHDFRNAIVALAEATKQAVAHVYKVLVWQQVIKSITYLSVILVLVIIPTFYFKRMRLWALEGKESGRWIAWILTGIVPYLAALIIFFSTISTIATGFANPEYGAMKDIVNMAQQVRNNPTVCQSCK